jgi:hypothetical protein
MSHISFFHEESDFYSALSGSDSETVPFNDAESAWFWCVQTSEAIHSGARLTAGRATTPRPCEAVDIQKVVINLARDKILSESHVKALCTYGPRKMRPSKTVPAALWQQAMQRITPVLQQKGIVA